jgi:NADPH:quinone reductase-like Zn-dependent oxidoreductase
MKAIVWDGKQATVATDIEARDIRAGEVRVRIEAAGLCHSDVSVLNGTIMFPPPVVLGHEGAGVVVQVGADVTNVEGRRPRGVVDARQLRAVRELRPGQADVLSAVARQAHPTLHQRRG